MDNLKFEKVDGNDLDAIIAILRDDFLGQKREENVGADCYKNALADILADKNQYLMKVLIDDKIIGTCHLTIMPSLTFSGKRRLNVEAVRIASNMRGKKVGEWMFDQIKQFAKLTECHMIQLACINERVDAKRFYERIGFKPTHTGYKFLF